MDFSFWITIIALLFSFFVVGALLGAAFSKPLRARIISFLRLEKLKHLISLKRYPHNPIMHPGNHPWTAEAVLNPAAAIIGGRTHLIYRAVGSDGISRLGYASSADGIVFDERLPYPIYIARNLRGPAGHLSLHRYSPMLYPSGG